MSTHVQRLTVEALETAWLTARTVDHAVILVDDSTQVVAAVDPRGRVVVMPEDELYRVAP